MIKEMTLDEINDIKTHDYPYLWNKLWNKTNEKYDKRNEEKFNIIKYEKSHLLEKYNIGWHEPEWGFPKGRRNFKEKEYECAFREFHEETGYDRKHLRALKNIYPFEEIFTGSNLKSYKHRYFLCYIDYEHTTDTKKFQKSEIGSLKWFSIHDACQHIRSYNHEKKLIMNIHNLIERNRIS